MEEMLYQKIDETMKKYGFTKIYNLLDKRFDWVIMFELDHINQWGAIMDCKQIID